MKLQSSRYDGGSGQQTTGNAIPRSAKIASNFQSVGVKHLNIERLATALREPIGAKTLRICVPNHRSADQSI